WTSYARSYSGLFRFIGACLFFPHNLSRRVSRFFALEERPKIHDLSLLIALGTRHRSRSLFDIAEDFHGGNRFFIVNDRRSECFVADQGLALVVSFLRGFCAK